MVRIISDNRIRNGSTTGVTNMHKDKFLTYQISLNLGTILPFLLCLITCFLLIISLWRHNRKMKLNATGFRDPSTEAHIKAMKVLISFVILFFLYFVGVAIETYHYTQPENKVLFIFGMATTAIYPWGHSFILILGNRKLKQASLKVLKHVKCWEREKLLRIPWWAWGELDVPREQSSEEIPEDLFHLHYFLALVLTVLLHITRLFHNYFDCISDFN